MGFDLIAGGIADTANQWTGNVRHVLAHYDQANSVLSHGLNMDFSGIESWLINADVAYSKAERDNYWNALYLDSFGNPFSYDLRGTPSVTVPVGSPSATPETADMAISDWNEGSILGDDLLSGQIDFSKLFDTGVMRSIDFGVRFSDREKEVTWTDYNWTDDEGLAWVWGANEVYANFPAGFPSSYTVSDIETLPWLDAPSYTAAVAQLTGGQTNFDSLATVNLDRYWKVTEQNTEAYVKVNFKGTMGNINYAANAGLRLVDFETESFANDGQSIVNDYSTTLPSATINFFLTEENILRVGISRAISRPPLDELRAGQYVSVVENAAGGNAGNPTLEPFASDQFDVSYKWYFADESLFAAAVYYKKVENYIGYRSFQVPTSGLPATIWAPDNGEGGNIKGFELTFQMPLGAGFGVYSNYAYADSNIKEFAPEDNPYTMAGLAQDTATVDFWYSNYDFEARLGWKYHSGYTTGFEWDGSALRSLDSEENINLSLAYAFTENFSVRLQGNNLTDEPLRLTQNNNDNDVRRYDVYGKTFLLDFTWQM
jgi:TonB-dependent receptor